MGLSNVAPSRPTSRTRYPIAEGIGVFVGLVAWDLLVDGHTDLVKAILIAAPLSLAWFAVRYWRTRNQNKQQ